MESPPSSGTPYPGLFRRELDDEAMSDFRLAVSQSQPLENSRFHAMIEVMMGHRREPRPRGRPRKQRKESPANDAGQGGYRFELDCQN